jgi:hypothetical protein
MDSDTFRRLAAKAVDSVARFIDEFPELYCEIRVGTKFGDIVVAIDEPKEADRECP